MMEDSQKDVITEIQNDTEKYEFLMKRATDVISSLHQLFPDLDKELPFLFDEEWLKTHFYKTFFSIKLDILNMQKCRECHEKGGAYWGTNICPMLTPTINLKTSKLYEIIKLNKEFCQYRLKSMAEEKARDSLKECGVTNKNLESLLFSNFDETKHPELPGIVKQCLKYINNFTYMQEKSKGLYFYSPNPMCGKSFLAVATCQKILEKYSIPFRYLHIPQFFRTFRKIIGNSISDSYDNEESAYGYMDSIATFEGILILDDFGKEKVSESTLSEIYDIISNRIENGLVTFYTSNYALVYMDEASNHKAYERLPFKYVGVTGNSILEKIKASCYVIDMSNIPVYEKDNETL